MVKRMVGPMALLTFAIVSFVAPAPMKAEEGFTEYRLKAAFLYHFFSFVEWPPPPLEEPTLCIAGDDPFGETLDPIEGKMVRGKPLVVRRIPSGEAIPQGCDILFVSRSESYRWEQIAGSLSSGTLTVSDIVRFSRNGGVIEMFLEKRKIRLAVSMNAARSSGLTISSRLLALAERVDE